MAHSVHIDFCRVRLRNSRLYYCCLQRACLAHSQAYFTHFTENAKVASLGFNGCLIRKLVCSQPRQSRCISASFMIGHLCASVCLFGDHAVACPFACIFHFACVLASQADTRFCVSLGVVLQPIKRRLQATLSLLLISIFLSSCVCLCTVYIVVLISIVCYYGSSKQLKTDLICWTKVQRNNKQSTHS